MNWKPITGYEDYYYVSDTGIVKSIDRDVVRSDGVVQRRRGRIKKQRLNKDGYATVKLSRDGVDKIFPVHSLVAREFVDGWFEGAEVNHKDFDRLNNNASNLEWMSHKDNVAYTINNGRHICTRDITGSNNPNYGNRKLSEKYKNDKELSIEKNSRPGERNGRARSVVMSFGEYDYRFGCLSHCAKYLIDVGISKSKSVSSLATKISQSAKSNTPYLGLRFYTS